MQPRQEPKTLMNMSCSAIYHELAPSDVSRKMSIGQRRTLGALGVCPMRCRWELNPTSPPTGRRLWLLLSGARCGVQLSSASGYASSERRLGLCKQGLGSSRPAVVRSRGRRGPSPRSLASVELRSPSANKVPGLALSPLENKRRRWCEDAGGLVWGPPGRGIREHGPSGPRPGPVAL